LEVTKGSSIDNILLEHFEEEIWSKVPHLEETKIVNATPLTDLTEDLKECAKSVYKVDFTDKSLLGKNQIQLQLQYYIWHALKIMKMYHSKKYLKYQA